MLQHTAVIQKDDATKMQDRHVAIGKIVNDTQLTTKDTGWSDAQKEDMRRHGYDSIDMIRAWYSYLISRKNVTMF